ncbi:MAG: hypothetical protein GXX96_30365 [Planctomycetaceae bacterium]|nr:hypothetical protein [Planctomycetaceae bacterium]
MLSRRTFLRSAACTAAALAAPSRLLHASDVTATIDLPELGRLAPLHSKQIKSSPFSVGFETLDRKGFDPKPTYKPLGRLGIKWARVQTGWCRCETVKGRYDFAWLDEVIDSLLAEGIQPWFNLGFGNKLYTPESHTPFAVGYAPVFTEEARAGWTAFVDAVATHFADRVTHWEIWNEPNIHPFWRQQEPDSADYVKLVELTAPILRRRVPEATLVGFALASGVDVRRAQYVAESLDAGIAQHIDRISYHPYSNDPDGDDAVVAELRRLIDTHQARLGLWQGECGRWADIDPRRPKLPWNEQRQAKWVLRRALNDLRHDVELTSYFHAVDLMSYSHGGPTLNARIGLLRGEDCSPRLSYYAYQTLCTLMDGQTELSAELKVAGEGIADRPFRAAGFTRNGRALYAWWSPVELFDEFTPGSVTLRLPAPAESTIDNPVLIDPLSQRIYRLPGKPVGGELTVTDLPLFDYPLLLTDRSVVPLRD